jgi:hypothetical protein
VVSSRIQFTLEIPEREGGIRLPPQGWTEEEFFHCWQGNGDLQIERTAEGEIIVTSSAGAIALFGVGKPSDS